MRASFSSTSSRDLNDEGSLTIAGYDRIDDRFIVENPGLNRENLVDVEVVDDEDEGEG